MADSDSGTHISDTTERMEEENELKTEERLEPITETISSNSSLSKPANVMDTKAPRTRDPEVIISNKPVRREEKETVESPRTSITESQVTEGTELSQSITRLPIRHEDRPIENRPQRSHSNAKHHSRENSQRTNHVTATAHVHSAPRVYRKLNGEIPPGRQVRRQRSLPPHINEHNGLPPRTRGGRGTAIHRSLESLHAPSHSGVRNAYEFMEANRRSNKKAKTKKVDIMDIELNDRESETDSNNNETDNASWAPTGIYAVFIITLWTALLKLMDSIGKNGPVICTEGEEVRLWICAGCLSLVYCLAELFWKRKGLTKALFGAILVFAYMIVGHTEPLSCRLGESKVDEISKWQAATNFFFGALLGAYVYQDIVQSIRDRRASGGRDRRRQRRKQDDDSSEDNGEPMRRVYRIV